MSVDRLLFLSFLFLLYYVGFLSAVTSSPRRGAKADSDLPITFCFLLPPCSVHLRVVQIPAYMQEQEGGGGGLDGAQIQKKKVTRT